MKFFLAALGFSIVIAAPAFAITNAVWSKARFEYVRARLQSNPNFYNYLLGDCIYTTKRTEDLKKLSAEIHVPLPKTAEVYCRRVLSAFASEKVSYEDYVNYQTKHIQSPSIARALQGKQK
ncbi:hypothetical protein [Rhizobium sp. RAF56]|jgi:hypothetical protein|uniref:hypothetical protein n=1 Tax=Rhizobium sp. RAF56 TaxID=3233062 RepID=UPI003F98697D